MALIDKLNNLGNAIRAKMGTTEKMTLEEMVTAVEDITARSIYKGLGVDNSVEVEVSLNLPTTTEIEGVAFAYDYALTNISMPNVVSIGNYAFRECGSLTSVTVGNNLTSIGNGAFYRCGALENITIPNSVTSIGSSAFGTCGSITSMVIPNSVTSIGDGAFRNCTSLTSVIIGSGVTSIGVNAFNTCDILTDITVDENNSVYNSVDGNLYTKDGKTLIQYAIGKPSTSFTIPDSVINIGDSAFQDCTSLTSVIIGNGVTSIGTYAFDHCTGLKTLTFKGTPTSIASNAFYGCPDLTVINVPWAEGAVATAPWGATNATINYNYTGG